MNSTLSTTSALFQPLLKPLISPEQYDFWARQLGSTDAWARCFARVVAVVQAPGGEVTLTLRPNRHFLQFAQTRQCDLRIEIDGRNRVTRFATTVVDRRLQIRVGGDAADPVGRHLRGNTRSGDIVELLEVNAAAEAAPGGAAAPLDADTALVYLRASDKTIPVARDVSLLEALEAAGVQPKFGCRRGICNRCSCTRVRGSTTDMVSGASSDAPGEPVRICINRATSDLELDL